LVDHASGGAFGFSFDWVLNLILVLLQFPEVEVHVDFGPLPVQGCVLDGHDVTPLRTVIVSRPAAIGAILDNSDRESRPGRM